MIGVEEIRIVLMPPVGVVPVVVVVVVAILVLPERIHHRPFRMIAVEPHDVVPMPPPRAVPLMTVVVSAPSGLSGSTVVALAAIARPVIARTVIAGPGTILSERRRRDGKRQNRARQRNRLFEFVLQFYLHKKQLP